MRLKREDIEKPDMLRKINIWIRCGKTRHRIAEMLGCTDNAFYKMIERSEILKEAVEGKEMDDYSMYENSKMNSFTVTCKHCSKSFIVYTSNKSTKVKVCPECRKTIQRKRDRKNQIERKLSAKKYSWNHIEEDAAAAGKNKMSYGKYMASRRLSHGA